MSAKRVLIVDDSALMRRIIYDIICLDRSFEVQDVAADGVEALQLMQKNEYDVVVLDMIMPKMNGIEVLKAMREQKIDIGVMVFSSEADDQAQIVVEALELGAIDFLKKPTSILNARDKTFMARFLSILRATADFSIRRRERAKRNVLMRGALDAKTQYDEEIPKASVASKEQKKPKTSKEAVSPETSEKPELAETTEIPGASEEASKDSDTRDVALRTAKAAERARNAASRARGAFQRIKNSEESAEKEKSDYFENNKINENLQINEYQKNNENLKINENLQINENLKINENINNNENIPAKGNYENCLVTIACSTGGPKALKSIIPYLPDNLNAPVLIVQHMPEGFTQSLAARMNDMSHLEVLQAEDGQVLENGKVYIAKGGMHLKVKLQGGKEKLCLWDGPAREGVKPCANYMFESLVDSNYEKILCIVLTGMGVDATKGIRTLSKEKDTFVIAQDEETSVVYGMPRSVAEAGLCDSILPLEEIKDAIIESVGVKGYGCNTVSRNFS